MSLYLLSFIVAFDHDRWYYRPIFLGALIPGLAAVLWIMYRGVWASIVSQIGVYSVVLFICVMACHGELARLKPHTRYLTSFYLMIAAGGALGGVFVALVAPMIFDAFWELHLGLWACCGLVLIALLADPTSLLNRGGPGRGYLAFAALCWFTLALIWIAQRSVGTYETMARNFYGVIRTEVGWDPETEQAGDYRALFHGRINHGVQYLGGASSRVPRSYFGPMSGVALAARHLPKQAGRRIGVIGLGVGTMAAFAGPGDEIRFYEINPIIETLATTLFRYLEESPAEWDMCSAMGGCPWSEN